MGTHSKADKGMRKPWDGELSSPSRSRTKERESKNARAGVRSINGAGCKLRWLGLFIPAPFNLPYLDISYHASRVSRNSAFLP